jgi:arsenite/tail-anchored protein-transporting ATPase
MSKKSVGEVAAEALPAVVIVAGKGGVGKTTVTAVMARGALDAGLKVLVVDLEAKPAWERLLPGGEESGVSVVHLRAQDLLEEYLNARKMGRIARRLRNSGVLEVVGAAAPGIEDLVILGKIKQLERSGKWDLILVDGPAAGHAITMLTSPSGIAAAVSSGPLRSQADEVRQFLSDPQRCMVMLVTLAEPTPVNELIETAFALEDRVGVQLGPVVVNKVDQPEAALMAIDLAVAAEQLPAHQRVAAHSMFQAAKFRQARALEQQRQITRLASELPLIQLLVAQVPTAEVTAQDIAQSAGPMGAWMRTAVQARNRWSQSGSDSSNGQENQ